MEMAGKQHSLLGNIQLLFFSTDMPKCLRFGFRKGRMVELLKIAAYRDISEQVVC